MKPIVSETVHGRERVYLAPRLMKQDSKLDQFGNDQKQKLHYEWKDVLDKNQGPRSHLSLSLLQYLRTLFLPIGYPKSVHPVYTRVHVWQFIETLLGSAVSVLCSEAMLTSIGVGSTEAVAGGAVAIQWVLKDGIGEIGKLFFIQQFAKTFDSHPKTWKLIGEVSCLFGSLLQLFTIISPPEYFLLLASLGYAARGIHFSIWGATHMTFTRLFALTGNVGDVVAKDDAQMSVAHLIGMLVGVSMISMSPQPWFLFTLFALLSPIHFYSTLALVRSAGFQVLNESKLILMAEHYVKHHTIPTLHQVQSQETWFGEYIHPAVDVTSIKMGVTIKEAFEDQSELSSALTVFEQEEYLLYPRYGHVYIIYSTDATIKDIIGSVLHAIKYARDMQDKPYMEAMSQSLHYTHTYVQDYIDNMAKQGWQVDAAFWGDSGNRAHWKKKNDLLEKQD